VTPGRLTGDRLTGDRLEDAVLHIVAAKDIGLCRA
jgi:hypothetical protein